MLYLYYLDLRYMYDHNLDQCTYIEDGNWVTGNYYILIFTILSN